MTERWMIVGQDPDPTPGDLPIVVEPIYEDKRRVPKLHVDRMPIFLDGDRWCRVSLPPEPEDEGVEVDFMRFRIDPTNAMFVQVRGTGSAWGHYMLTYVAERTAKVAIALGLVDAPALPADVQRVVDAAKAWRKRFGGRWMEREELALSAAVGALGDDQ